VRERREEEKFGEDGNVGWIKGVGEGGEREKEREGKKRSVERERESERDSGRREVGCGGKDGLL
jgi:hypothetical protein